MHKAKNIYFLLVKKKTRWPKAGGGLKQGTFAYIFFSIFTKTYLQVGILYGI